MGGDRQQHAPTIEIAGSRWPGPAILLENCFISQDRHHANNIDELLAQMELLMIHSEAQRQLNYPLWPQGAWCPYPNVRTIVDL